MPTARALSRWGPERPRAGKVAALFALVVSCWPHAGWAEESARTVVLVHPAIADDAVSEATTRLRAELVAAGFGVDELVLEAGTDPEQGVAAAGFSTPPAATLAISGDDGDAAVDMWIADPTSHATLVRHVDVAGVARQRAPSVLAVRAVELLRASLLGQLPREATPKVAPAPAKTPAPKERAVRPSTTVTPAVVERTARTFRVAGEVGAAMLYGAHGISPAFAPLFRVQVGTETWAGRLNLVAPAFGAEASATGGTAKIRQELLSLDATATWPAKGVVAVVGSVGGGGYHWHIDGAGVAPNVGHDGERWGGVADVGLGALFRFGARMAVLVDVHALWLAPPLVVQIAGADAARSGQPTLSTSVGFRAEL